MERRHVCIISTAHPLDDVRVNSKVAQSFIAAGYQVSWVGPDLTFFSDQPYRDARIKYSLTRPNRSRLDRLGSFFRVRRAARRVKDVDWYYAPSPDAVEVALSVARRSHAKVLFDVLEIYHGALLDRWVLGRRAKLFREYLRRRIARSCRRSDVVSGVSQSVIRPYASDIAHTVILRNCAPVWFADGPVAAGSLCNGGPLRVMHGKGVPNNGTLTILDAATKLPNSQRVQIVVFPWLKKEEGPYIPDLHERIASGGVGGRFELRDSVTHKEMPGIMGGCDVGMIAYGRDLGEDSLPNRLFEYMACGLAVLTPSYSGEITNIVESERIGLSVDTERADEIARALLWFAEHPQETREMGLRARAAFVARHNWSVEFDQLTRAMDQAEAR